MTNKKKSGSDQIKKRTIPHAYQGSQGSRRNEWLTHEDKVMAAIEKRTDIWMADLIDKIRKASSEESARKSFVAGMTNMITVARNALGFWGAEQVLMELERWNSTAKPDDGDDDDDDDSEEVSVHISANGLTREQLSKDTEGLQEHITNWMDEKRRTEQKQARDPMFA
jgi:hypothetical protein